MALSNIFREPRREITESVVGIAAFAVLGAADWWFATWFANAVWVPGDDWWSWMVVGLAFGALIVFGLLLLTLFVHYIGEELCDFLENRGVDPRPKQRY